MQTIYSLRFNTSGIIAYSVVQYGVPGVPDQMLEVTPEGDLLSVRDATAAEVAVAIDNEAQNQGVTP